MLIYEVSVFIDLAYISPRIVKAYSLQVHELIMARLSATPISPIDLYLATYTEPELDPFSTCTWHSFLAQMCLIFLFLVYTIKFTNLF